MFIEITAIVKDFRLSEWQRHSACFTFKPPALLLHRFSVIKQMIILESIKTI